MSRKYLRTVHIAGYIQAKSVARCVEVNEEDTKAASYSVCSPTIASNHNGVQNQRYDRCKLRVVHVKYSQ